MALSVPSIIREKADGKSKGKQWLQKNMPGGFFMTDQQPEATLIFEDVMGIIKSIHPGTADTRSAFQLLYEPVTRNTRHYFSQACTMVQCFDYYDDASDNPLKAVCHRLRTKKQQPIPELKDSYIDDWDAPLPANWEQLLEHRSCVRIVLRDLITQIIRKRDIPCNCRLIICGHTFEYEEDDFLGLGREGEGDGKSLSRKSLVMTHNSLYFDDKLTVLHIEADLQIFALLQLLHQREDIVHLLSKDTDVMYYAMQWLDSHSDSVAKLMWRHQVNMWMDTHKVRTAILQHKIYGEFTHAVTNLIVMLTSFGTDYTSGFKGLGHIKLMKNTNFVLYGRSKKRKLLNDTNDIVMGFNREFYSRWITSLLRDKAVGNSLVIKNMAAMQHFYVVSCLGSIGESGPPENVHMEDYSWDAVTNERIYYAK